MEKSFVFLLLMLFTSTAIFSQNNNTPLNLSNAAGQNDLTALQAPSMMYKKPLMQASLKATQGAGLRNAGIAVAAAGVCLIGGGIAMILDAGTASYQYSNTNGYVEESGSLQGGLGGVMVGVGALATAGGIVMIIIGQKKFKRSNSRTSLNLSPVFTSFTYRF